MNNMRSLPLAITLLLYISPALGNWNHKNRYEAENYIRTKLDTLFGCTRGGYFDTDKPYDACENSKALAKRVFDRIAGNYIVTRNSDHELCAIRYDKNVLDNGINEILAEYAIQKAVQEFQINNIAEAALITLITKIVRQFDPTKTGTSFTIYINQELKKQKQQWAERPDANAGSPDAQNGKAASN